MNIFVAGGGRVGFHLARLLSIENHDVTVIEQGAGPFEQVDFALDVRTILGNAASVLLQQETGVADADLFVSMTGADEINLIAAATAKGLGAKQVVARVDDLVYIESNILYETILGIDYILSPNALSALEIAKSIESPGMVAAEEFARGLVQVRQLRVSQSPTTNGKTLQDVLPPGSGVLLGLITRKGVADIPHGDSVVEPGDLVTLIGRRDAMPHVQSLFQGTEQNLKNVVIMGGGQIGMHLAQVLETRRRSVKLFDLDMNRCNLLAGKLHKTKIVCRDATARGALDQENVESADVFVATTNDDERNIMASVLAKEVGVGHAIAVVHQPDFAPLALKLGIDHAVTPRACVANRVLRLVHQRSVTSLAVLEEGEVEVLEVAVTSDAPVLGRTLKDLRNKFPRGALVAAILRDDDVIVPSGDDQVQAGDSLVVIATPDSLDPVVGLFHK